MSRLSGKVALVTGASRGIGAAIAVRLAKDGAKVAVNYSQNRAAAETVVRAIRANNGEAIMVRADLSDLAQIAPMVEQTVKTFGKLDILVNNAAIADTSKLLDQIDTAHYASQFDLNVRGLLFTSQAALKHLPDGGRIINITSGIVRARAPGASVYSATKAAVEALTRCHSTELGRRQITVNSVAPGTTDTEMLRAGRSDAILKEFIARTPLGRLGSPEDIADVVAFIASDEARWITGEVIPVNGGLG